MDILQFRKLLPKHVLLGQKKKKKKKIPQNGYITIHKTVTQPNHPYCRDK